MRVELLLRDVPPLRRAQYENELSRLLAACGCPEGALGALLGAAVAGGLTFVTGAGTGVALLASAAGLSAGVVIGKITGLAIARRRLRQLAVALAAGSDADGRTTPP